MIYNMTSLPSIFHVEHGCLDGVGTILDSHGVSINRTLVLTGRTNSAVFAAQVADGLPGCSVYHIDEYSEQEVLRLRTVMQNCRATLIVAVGGGGVIDVAKRASKLYAVPCLVVPTVVSNDGLMSPIAVLAVSPQRRESLPAAMPVGVIADLDVLMSAPREYIQAAGGDLLSNLSATSDWRHVFQRDGGQPVNDAAFHLSRNAAESLVHWADVDVGNPRFVQSLVVAQIYSGIAMTLAGTSRPCSGPEHLISHALDELGLTRGVLHGVQVGSICLFVLYLLGELSHEVMRFSHAMRLPPLWTSLSGEITGKIDEVFTRAREVRPDRRTILDDFTNEQIIRELRHFQEWRQPKLRAG